MRPETLGRLLKQTNPNLALALIKKNTAMLTKKDYGQIPEVVKVIDNKFPELDDYYRRILISCCVYQLFCPASLAGCRIENAPAGMRMAVADILGYVNGTNVNYWQDIARSHVKNERYVDKVQAVTDHFKPISKNPYDGEIPFKDMAL